MWTLLCRLVCDNIMLFPHNSHTSRRPQLKVHQQSSSQWQPVNFLAYISHLKFFTCSCSPLRWQCSLHWSEAYFPHTTLWIRETCYSLTKFFQCSHSKIWFPSTGSSEFILKHSFSFVSSSRLPITISSILFTYDTNYRKINFHNDLSVALLGRKSLFFK